MLSRRVRVQYRAALMCFNHDLKPYHAFAISCRVLDWGYTYEHLLVHGGGFVGFRIWLVDERKPPTSAHMPQQQFPNHRSCVL